MGRLIRKFQFFIGGLIVWIKLGIPFSEAMRSAKEAEEMTRDL